MNNNTPILSGLDRGRPQSPIISNERISFQEAFNTLTDLYCQLGLPEASAIQAAHADLKMRYGALALAA